MRQEKNQAREVRKPREVKAEPATSRVIRDVLMDDLEEVTRVKSGIESGAETKAESLTESRVARNARVIREAQPRRDGKGLTPKVNRNSGAMVGRWIQIRLWLKKLAAGLLVLLAIWGGYKALGPLMELFQRPIKSVTVEGEFHFISQ